MLLAERAGRKLEPWSNSRPRGMAVIAGQPAVTESGLSAYFIFPSAFSCKNPFTEVEFACSHLRGHGFDLGLADLSTPIQNNYMTLHLTIGPLLALIAGILILIMPRLLNFIVALYFILIGIIGLFGLGGLHLHG